jgi:hypothetical protein
MYNNMKDLVKLDEVVRLDSDSEEDPIELRKLITKQPEILINQDVKALINKKASKKKKVDAIESMSKTSSNKLDDLSNADLDLIIKEAKTLNESTPKESYHEIKFNSDSIMYSGKSAKITGLSYQQCVNCVILLSNKILSVGGFRIFGDVAVLDKPCGYAFGDYVNDRFGDRISRLNLMQVSEEMSANETKFKIEII